jgi:hypothetical protein
MLLCSSVISLLELAICPMLKGLNNETIRIYIYIYIYIHYTLRIHLLSSDVLGG